MIDNMEQRLWAAIDQHGVKELPSDIVEAVSCLAAGWRPPQPEPADDEMMARAKRWVFEDPTDMVRREIAHDFARWGLAERAAREAAEQDGAAKSKLLARCHSDKDVLRERAEAAERDVQRLTNSAIAEASRALAAEAEGARLREALERAAGEVAIAQRSLAMVGANDFNLDNAGLILRAALAPAAPEAAT